VTIRFALAYAIVALAAVAPGLTVGAAAFAKTWREVNAREDVTDWTEVDA
jgi:hypothetical protein